MKVQAILGELYALLPERNRRQVVPLLLLMLVNAGSEISGVASLLPFVTVAADPTRIHTQPWLQAAYVGLGFTSATSFLVALGLVFVGFLSFMNAVNAFTWYLSIRFSYSVGSRLGRALLRRYLDRPYVWFLDRNTTDLANSVLGEVDSLTDKVLNCALDLLISLTTGAFLLVALLALDPTVALGTGCVLGLAYMGIFRHVRGRAQRLGERRLALNAARHRSVRDALNGAKEARAFARADSFLRPFQDVSKRYADLVATERLSAEMPRYLTETLALLLIGAVLIYLVTRGESTLHALPRVGLYIMATWRIIPSLQSIYRNIVRLRYYSPVIQQLRRELEHVNPERSAGPRLELERRLELRGVSYHYPNAVEPALTDVDLTIPRGSLVALVGKTGSGKSTLADLLAGLLHPGRGEVRVDDTPLDEANRNRWLANLGYVPQDVFLVDDTLMVNVALGCDGEIDRARAQAVVSSARLDEIGLDTPLGERGVSLSGGQRQRVGIARALYSDPGFLIFDEATSSLDNLTEAQVMQAIRTLPGNPTVCLIAHRLSTVEACDCIFLLEQGRLVAQGTYAELLENSPLFRALVQGTQADPAILQ